MTEPPPSSDPSSTPPPDPLPAGPLPSLLPPVDAPAAPGLPRRRRINRLWTGVAALYTLLLLTLTHIPLAPQPPDAPFNDKWKHLCAYFVLGIAGYGVSVLNLPRWRNHALIVFVAGGIFGALDELTQPLTGRTADILDWRADLVGLAAAAVVMIVTLPLIRRMMQPARPASVQA